MYVASHTKEGGKMRKAGIVMVLAVVLLATPLLAGVASAGDSTNNTITPSVEQGTTDRLGGGDWVVVHAGSTNFGVVYGTAQDPNKLYIVADYKRYIAGVDYYDAQGNFIKTQGVPVWTVFAQSLDRFIEFKDTDGNHRFDMRMWNGSMENHDVPVKSLDLDRAWTLSALTNETVGNVMFVNFTLSISDTQYSYMWSQMMRRPIPAPASLGDVAQIAFTFHIRVAVEDSTTVIPWFNVTINGGDQRRVVDRSFAGWRTFTGQSVNMSAKYDQYVEGWDFASDESNLLLETHLMFGNVVPSEVLNRYRMREGNTVCDRDCTDSEHHDLGNDSREMPSDPRNIETEGSQGLITFADDWTRIGRFTWSSEVSIDGQQETMYFQVHGGGPFSFVYNRVTFVGMHVLGAFVYPAAQNTIFHDPGFDAVSNELSIPSITNLAPQSVLLLQLAVVVIAVIAAVVVRAAKKGQK
jgi:hypothetical protein